MLLYFISSLSFILLASAFTVWQIDKSRGREQDAYSKVIDSLLVDKSDCLDRFFMSKGLPPTKTDVQKQAQEKAAQKDSSDGQKSGLPKARNPVDVARNEAIASEAERLK